MSRLSTLRAGQASANTGMTDTWAVYRYVQGPLNESTGQYDPVATTVYLGPGKSQSFTAREETPVAAGHQATVERPSLHLPANAESALVEVSDVAVRIACLVDPALVGDEVTIQSIGSGNKTYMTARRFPVSEVIA